MDTKREKARQQAENLLFGENSPERGRGLPAPLETRLDDWYAQPAVGDDIRTYTSSSRHPGPVVLPRDGF